jgi:hypothetical protein
MYIERECPYAGNCFSLRSWIRGCIRGYPPQDTLPQKIRPSKFKTSINVSLQRAYSLSATRELELQ